MKESEILKRIYPSVVTYKGDWPSMIKDVSRLKLKKISLFLTTVGIQERQKIYQALANTSIKEIPHVHVRHDMQESELDFLISQYKTKAFTVHYQYFLKYFKNSKYKKRMFIENNDGQASIKSLAVLKQAGGICIDLAHLEQFRIRSPRNYQIVEAAIQKYKIGCNHLSAVLPKGQSWHYVKNVSELDYVKNIPKHYFSRYINLELINSIPQQLKFKKQLAKILAKSWGKSE